MTHSGIFLGPELTKIQDFRPQVSRDLPVESGSYSERLISGNRFIADAYQSRANCFPSFTHHSDVAFGYLPKINAPIEV